MLKSPKSIFLEGLEKFLRLHDGELTVDIYGKKIRQRSDLVSFLCFAVLSGEGELSYEGQTYQLHSGDCVFIDCRKAYSHSTSDNLWSLQSKIFKETYGTTVNNYLISKRITRAKQLLRFTDMTVDEIGVAVGMGDANYFSRMFRKVEGSSPSEYRKQW